MQVKTEGKLIPNLRFGEFNEIWEKKKLGDYYKNLRTGMTPSRRNKDYFKGDISWITSGELNYGTITDTKEKISDLAVRNTNLKIYPPYTFFIAITGLEAPGTRGKCGLNGIPSTTNQSCMAFEKIERVETIFLFYWYIKYGVKFFFRFAQGTKQQSFNNKIVEKFEFCLPTLPEQQKIASFLTSVDDKLNQLTKKKELLIKYKKGVMQKIFSQEIRFKDDNGNKYPDWEEKKLGAVCKVIVGGTPSTVKKEYWKGDIGWLSSGGLNNGNVIKPSKLITKLGLDNSSAKMMPENTVLLAMTGATLGKIGYLKFNCSGNQSVAGFLPNNTYKSKYLFYTIKKGINQVFKYAGGAAQQGINKQSILNLKYKFPVLEEQKKIADFLSSLDGKIELVIAQIVSTKSFKKGLLQQMFV